VSYAEDIRGLNRLCDMAAERFEGSVHGRFPKDVVAATVDKMRRAGLIRLKSPAEIRAACEQIDREQLARAPARSKSRYIGRGGYPADKRAAVVEMVETTMRENNLTMTQACSVVGTTPKSYRAWKGGCAK